MRPSTQESALPFTEIPLDELDMVPAAPNATEQKNQSVDAMT